MRTIVAFAPSVPMSSHHGSDVHRRHDVSVEHHDGVVDPLRGIANGAARAEWRRFHHVSKAHPQRRAVAKGLFESARLVVQAEDDLVDFGHALQEIDLILKKGPVENRHDRLRRVQRERAESRALAAGEQDSFHVNRRSYTSVSALIGAVVTRGPGGTIPQARHHEPAEHVDRDSHRARAVARRRCS